MNVRIPEDKVIEIRQSVDIVDVISDYVQLKKQGRNYFGLCPFHNENTPSFSVAPEKQIFHCFGCGVGGNVFTFLMEAEGLSFQEAAGKVAKKGGVHLEVINRGQQSSTQLPEDQQRMIDAHELLGKFYHHLLVNTKEGSRALDYLLKRGFTDEGIRKFQVGYSLPDWEIAVKLLNKHGFSDEEMERAGLIVKRDGEEGYFDRFRNRLMFPLKNNQGKTVGFSARALSNDDHPKYLNTPETVLFNKSSLLYNFYGARSEIRKQNTAILFEGFADVIAADSANVSNGLAVMGTSLTDRHVQSVRRLTDSVILCFDADQAGKEAAFRAGSLLIDHGLKVSVAMMPDEMDPDDYIRTYGGEKFKTDVIGNPYTWTAFKLQYHRLGKNLQNEGEKLNYVEEVIKELSVLDNAIERDLYLRQIADEFSLSLNVLKDQLQHAVQANRRNYKSPPAAKENFTAPIKSNHQIPQAHLTAEKHLLARMMQDDDLAYRIMAMLGDTTFHYAEHQAILTYLIGYYEDGNPPDPSLFLNYLPDKKLRAIVTEIQMLTLDSEYSEQELNDYVKYVLNHPKLLMIKEKQAEQKKAERNNDHEKAVKIALEIIELRKLLLNM